MSSYGLFWQRRKGSRAIRLYPKHDGPKQYMIRVFQSVMLHLSFRGKRISLRNLARRQKDAQYSVLPGAKAGTAYVQMA